MALVPPDKIVALRKRTRTGLELDGARRRHQRHAVGRLVDAPRVGEVEARAVGRSHGKQFVGKGVDLEIALLERERVAVVAELRIRHQLQRARTPLDRRLAQRHRNPQERAVRNLQNARIVVGAGLERQLGDGSARAMHGRRAGKDGERAVDH